MPNIPQPQRQDEPVVTDADLAALLAGTTDIGAGLRPVADVLTALTAEPTIMELAGEAGALAEFRRCADAPVSARRARRGTTGLSSRFGVKVGASVTAVAVLLGGGAAAAFADVLPAPIQRLAHEAIGAPVPASRHNLPADSRPGVPGRYGRYGVHGRSGGDGKTPVRGGPGANRQPRPRPTPTPTAHGNPQGQGNHGNQGKGKGKEGQGSGQGHQGSGQGNQSKGQGQGKSQGQRGGAPQGSAQQSKSQGQRGGAPQGSAQQGNPHRKGPRGNSQANRRPAGHPRRHVRTRPVMDP